MSLRRKFFHFVIPSIISMWIYSLYTMVDGIFVAGGVSEHALAAVNLSLPYVNVLFSVGVTALVSGLTIGGKALGKNFAMKQSTEVVFLAGRLLHIFHRSSK